MTFDRNEAIRFGWDTTKKNLAFFIGILVISGIFQLLPDVMNKFVLQPFKGNLIVILIRMIVILAFAIINIIISIGLIRIPLKFADNEKPQFADLFSGARFFFKYIIATILYGLIIVIGFCLLIIPGIIMAIRFSFYFYFIVDRGAGPIEALKSSFNLTRGNTWNLFKFGIIAILLNFLGALALFVGLFITLPITMVAYAYIYRELTSESLEMAAPKAGYLSQTKKDIQPKTIDLNYKDEKMEKMVDETEKSREDILKQNQDERTSKYDDMAVPEGQKRYTKQKKEKKGLKLPSKVQILSKIGLSRTGELIGVDIGTSSIKLSTVKKTKEGYNLTHIAKKIYNENLLTEGHIVDQDFVAHEIREIVSKSGIKSTIAASALSSYGAITKKIRLPLTEDMDIDKVMKNPSILEEEGLIITEIESSIPFQLKEVYYSYHVSGLDPEDENFINVIFVVSKKEVVDGFINTFRNAGLKLVLLDLDLICLINIIEQIYGLHGSPIMIVDLGASTMNMAIVKGADIELTREIMLGGIYLTEQIQRALKINYAEAEERKIKADPEINYLFEDFIFNVSSEMNKTINFYLSTKPNERISKIYITGGGSLLEGLKEKIYGDTNTNIEIIDPFLLIGGENAVRSNVYKDFKEFIPVAMHLSTRIDDIAR